MEMLNHHCGVNRDSRGVVRLTICNAGSLNILGSPVTDGVREGFERLASDRAIRAVILAGQGEKSMIGGADIKEMATLDQESAEAFISRLRDLCEAVRAFPAPVIARMPGWCLGGGLEVAAACDVRIAAHDAKFGMPEVRVGIPSVIHAALLPRLIGWGRARWLVLVNTFVPRPWEHEVNVTLAAAARRYPNVLLVNWHDAIEHHTRLLWSDGIHPQPAGGVLYARVIRARVLLALRRAPVYPRPQRRLTGSVAAMARRNVTSRRAQMSTWPATSPSALTG